MAFAYPPGGEVILLLVRMDAEVAGWPSAFASVAG
jgi:hypothetical protein